MSDFDVLYLDPPWPYNARNNSQTRFGGGAGGHYAGLTWEELGALDVMELAAPRCMAFVWMTWPYLPRQVKIVEGWGFRYVGLGFDWVKLNQGNGRPFFGVGFYAKSNSEPCLLFCRRGARPLRPATNRVSSLVESVRRGHSQKPTEVRDRIDLLYPASDGHRRVELFAREEAVGWTSLGLELNGWDARTLRRSGSLSGSPGRPGTG